MPSFTPVTALQRGLEILRVVNALGEPNIAEVQRRTQLHRATVVRLLETLENAGYVMRRADSARYVATGRTLQLSSGYRSHERISQLAEPILGDIRERLGWPSAIAIPDRTSMLIVHSTRAFGGLVLNGRAGTHAPMLGSSLGRAYIASCTEEVRERMLTLLRSASSDPFDQKWIADRSKLDADLQRTRRLGYALADEAYTLSIYNDSASGFAVPVHSNGKAIASINIVFFLAALSLKDAVTTFVPVLHEAAHHIGSALAAEHGGELNTADKPAQPAPRVPVKSRASPSGDRSFPR